MTTYGYSSYLLTSITDPNGDTTTNVYNGTDQVTSQTDPMGRATTYAYGTGAGYTDTTITDPHGWETYDYFPSGQLEFSTIAYGTSSATTTHYIYDGNGDLLSTTDPNRTSPVRRTTRMATSSLQLTVPAT